jgi:hypothetical protein
MGLDRLFESVVLRGTIRTGVAQFIDFSSMAVRLSANDVSIKSLEVIVRSELENERTTFSTPITVPVCAPFITMIRFRDIPINAKQIVLRKRLRSIFLDMIFLVFPNRSKMCSITGLALLSSPADSSVTPIIGTGISALVMNSPISYCQK